MLIEIQNEIIARLEEIEGPKVDSWVGDWETLMAQGLSFPSLWVVYGGAGFGEKRVIGSVRADHTMSFLVLLLHKNLKSRKACAAEAYAIIEAVRGKLIGCQILSYGWLWPENEDFLGAENGMLVYGLGYRMKTNT